ncbi:Uroporphyrinogen decarboxylase [Planctomycetes bacterium Pan216]|uniref:Uroporphyrinogen decarboxylase n=1 Tax=Kolteria novifilia TaxID=2527975 RepID=A0A518B920_9BACT|nr:Uroporphyrinogen decarboxylase [Planctomycetes bacterium Pan216]
MAVESGDREHLLTRALRGEKVERTPVWAMRQAGRWDPEFRRLRGDLSFYEFNDNVELSAQATLCPRRFGVDGIILFYDITTLAIAMGQRFKLVPKRGPVPDHPIRSMADVQKLDPTPDPSRYANVLEILRTVKRELDGELPILSFAGAPFTLATYMIGTGKDLVATRRFIAEQGATWRELLERISRATSHFLGDVLGEGAVAYQLFDSWAGGLAREEYLEHAQRYHQRVFSEVAGTSILFVKDLPYVDLAVESGVKVLSLGKNHDLAAIKQRHPDLVVQGNVDHELLIDGSQEEVREATRTCLEHGGGERHVLNLDHGMDRLAKPENFEAFVGVARER